MAPTCKELESAPEGARAPPLSLFWKVMLTVVELTALTDTRLAVETAPVVTVAGVIVIAGLRVFPAAGTASCSALEPPSAFWKVIVTLVLLVALTPALVVLVDMPLTVEIAVRALSAFWILACRVLGVEL